MHYLNQTATITNYLVENTTSKMRPAILILPGGSYLYTSPREAKPVAISYNAGGIHAFVLDYTTFQKSKTTNIEKLIDEVKLAYDYIVSNHKEFQVDINQIFIIGFSAGGHLAAAAINQYPKMFQKAILGYPALNLVMKEGKYEPVDEWEFIIRMFRDNLILDVTKNNPPTFIWHTQEDETVPIEGSIEYIHKLNQLGVPFEAHFYQTGWHGLSIANEIVANEDGNRTDLHAASWVGLSISWLLK
ncbi:MAG: alpha/beta hydrolase [Acholeplasmataceae bacterium]|jgi:acetyl esterase/lipase